MIEKIEVSRDEVLHYSWIDHTWVYIHYTKNSITKDPLFSRGVKALLKLGILETTGQKYENISMEDGYVFIRHDTNEIVEILKNATKWLVNSNLYVKDPNHPLCMFFLENKSVFYEFFKEIKEMLERKAYKYYFQRVDGMN